MKNDFEIMIVLKVVKNINLENLNEFNQIKNDLKYCQSLIQYIDENKK